MLLSMVVTTYFKNSLNYLKIGSMNYLIRFLSLGIIILMLFMLSGIDYIQLSNRTCVPRA